MITNKNDVLAWYDKNKGHYPYWFLFSSPTSKEIIDSAPNVDNYTPEEGYQDLNRAISRLAESQKVMIKLKDTYSQNNSAHIRSVDFFVPRTEPETKSKEISGFDNEDKINSRVDKLVKQQIEAYKAEEEKKSLQAQINELKAQLENGGKKSGKNGEMYGFLNEVYQDNKTTIQTAIEGILMNYADGNKPTTTIKRTKTMAGIGQTKISENADDGKKLAALLQRWHAKEPDMVEVVEKIVLLAENSPIKYQFAKSKL